MADFANLEEKLDAARDGSGNGGSSTDNENYPRCKMTPNVAIRGTLVDVAFLGDTSIEQNLQGNDDWRAEGDFLFTLEDPEMFRGTVFEAAGRTDAENNLAQNMDSPALPGERTPSRSFRAVPADWEDTRHVDEKVVKIDGDYEPVGISPFGSDFIGEETTFSEALEQHSRIDVLQGSQSGRRMASSLDATQETSAYVANSGEKTNGLVEYPDAHGSSAYDPTGDDPYPRVARQPQVHPDLEGKEVVLFLHFAGESLGDADEADDSDGDSSNYRTHYGKVFAEIDGETVNLTEADDALDVREDVVDDRASYLVFDEPATGWSTSDESGGESTSTAATDGGTATQSGGGGVTFDALNDADSADDVGGETGYNDLDTNTQEFVDTVVDLADGFDSVGDVMDDFDSKVEETVASGAIEDVEADTLRSIVNGRL